MVQDKNFDDEGQLDSSHSFLVNLGILGKEILVNGTPNPYVDVTTEALRLRLLNASNARVYNFGFDDLRRFDVIATDGGLLAAPVALNSLQLSPGERAEIVVRMKAGEQTVLRSEKLEGSRNVFGGSEARFDILQLRAAPALAASPRLPSNLASVPQPDESESTGERSFDLSGTDINQKEMDMSRIDETIAVGTTETWTVRNRDSNHHNFHVHDVRFRILEIAGRAPPPVLAGWKDTVWVPAGEDVRLMMRFEDYADEDSPYMFHCHMLRHEDRGMMGQFVVVQKGESAGRVDQTHH